MKTIITRPPVESLACVEPDCDLYGQQGLGNLTVRKTYGKDEIRLLRCTGCGSEFSAPKGHPKGTGLWNTKVREYKAVSVAEHLGEGCSQESTARLAKVDISVVQRLNREVGKQGQRFHDERVRDVAVEALEADERHGFSDTKQTPAWEAEVIDPQSKLVFSHQQGRRDEELIRRLYSDVVERMANPHNLVLFTDGESSYASLFPEFFGVAYQPRRQGTQGRLPQIRYRIPRTVAHVQIIKRRQGHRVVEVDVRYTHGSRKRAEQALDALGYTQPNTSAIERRNATARRMSVYQIRKRVPTGRAFSRRPAAKQALGWWGVTVYNWCRKHRSLRFPLAQPEGKKSSSSVLRLWQPVSPMVQHPPAAITFSQSGNSCSHQCTLPNPADNLT